MAAHTAHSGVQEAACLLLATLSNLDGTWSATQRGRVLATSLLYCLTCTLQCWHNAEGREAIVAAGAIDCVLAAIAVHKTPVGVQTCGLYVLVEVVRCDGVVFSLNAANRRCTWKPGWQCNAVATAPRAWVWDICGGSSNMH